MRKYIVAGNWKMNTTPSEGVKLASEINEKLTAKQANDNCGVVIAPPYTHLSEVSKVIDTDKICLAAQNCASEENGAYTGEVAISMLKEIGVQAVIIGHSERRSYYNEDDDLLNKKVKIVLNSGLKPIFCCGEVLSEREAKKHFEVVKTQVEKALFDLTPQQFDNVIIAYEPVWAIGTGVVASSEQAQEMHAYIRKLITDKFGKEVAQNTTILYGGSCKPSNAEELFTNEDVDGGLIGGASLNADDFMGIIDAVKS
jgi:triosephosphate isomerase